MEQVEGTIDQPIHGEDLLALIDMLQSGELDDTQQQAVQALRDARSGRSAANMSLTVRTMAQWRSWFGTAGLLG